MRLLTTRLTQKFIVEPDDGWVLVRLANGFSLILGVERSRTPGKDLAVAMMIRLSATTDASTRASHDLDGMLLRGAGSHFIQQLTSVAQTVGNTDVEL